MRILPILGITMILAGCVFSHGEVDPQELPDPASPYGGTLQLVLSPRLDAQAEWDLSGELLAVEPDTVLLLAGGQLLRVPISDITRARTARQQQDPTTGPFLGLEGRDRLRPLARYPDGLSDAKLHRLRDSMGQDRPDQTMAAFFDSARAAADRFTRIESAIAAGYRRLGPSFPGMGEHWIHPGLIVQGQVRPDRPPVLCYTRIDNEPRLIALAFTLPLEGDESPPSAPFGATAWHDHADGVDEESLLLAHPGSHSHADGPRLAMVHTWLWLDNPDGVLAQNNWRLPFLQAGLDLGGLKPSSQTARGLSLWTAEPGYYERLFRAAGDPDAEELELLLGLLAEHRARAGEWVERRTTDTPLTEAELWELNALWTSLWSAIRENLSPDTWRRLAVLR